MSQDIDKSSIRSRQCGKKLSSYLGRISADLELEEAASISKAYLFHTPPPPWDTYRNIPPTRSRIDGYRLLRIRCTTVLLYVSS